MRRIINLAAALLLSALAMGAAAAQDRATPRPGYWQSGQYTNTHGTRDYRVWIPAGYNARHALPLVVMLHGCGQSVEHVAGVTRFNQIADDEHFIVLYPQQSPDGGIGLCWNWYEPHSQQRDSGDPSLIAGMTEQVTDEYRVDARRRYVTGGSAGGAMASIMLACYPDLFAAGAVIAGGMYRAASGQEDAIRTLLQGSALPPDIAGSQAWECSGRHRGRVPVIVVHGTIDPRAHPLNGIQAMAQFLQMNDLSDDRRDNDSIALTRTDTRRHQVPGGYSYLVTTARSRGEVLAQHYAIEGMGHSWSGGDPAFPYADPAGPDASRILWNFFKQHRRHYGQP